MKLDYIRRDWINKIDGRWMRVLEDQRKEDTLKKAFENEVIIKHQDGSLLHYKNSFYVKNKKKLILVLTEHLGYFTFYTEDLESYKEYKMKKRILDKNLRIEQTKIIKNNIGFKTDKDLSFKFPTESKDGLTYIGKSRIDGLKMYSVNMKKFIKENKLENSVNTKSLELAHIEKNLRAKIYPISMD